MFEHILEKIAQPAPAQSLAVVKQQVPTPTLAPSPVTMPMPVFQADQVVTLQSLGMRYETILDPVRAAEVISSLQGCFAGVDIETTPKQIYSDVAGAALSPHLSDIRTVQLYSGGDVVYIIDVRHAGASCLRGLQHINSIAHNALFEMQHLHAIGVDMPGMHCSMLMSNALGGGHPSLRKLANSVLKMDISKDQQISDWGADILSQEQLEYASLDAIIAWKLYQPLHASLQEGGAMGVYSLMQGALWAMMDLAYTGIRFDLNALSSIIALQKRHMDDITLKLTEMFGASFNPASGPQIEKWVIENIAEKKRSRWPKTETGHLATDKAALSKFAAIPNIALILEYKGCTKLMSTYGAKLISLCNPRTGRIHPQFKIAGAISGRMTCSAPNTQNIPRDKSYRALIKAPDGRSLICADYGQIELRILAELSQDPNMRKVYMTGGDLHSQTAKAITGRQDITREDRQCAKAANFGLVYGQGLNGFRDFAAKTYHINLNHAQAINIINAFFAQYPQLKPWQNAQARSAEQSRVVQTISGRTHVIAPDKKTYTTSMNFPVQGAGAEVLYAALGKLPGYLDGLDAHIINCVHDEILLEASDQDAEAAKAALERAMLEGFQQIFPNAPTKNLVEAHIGQNWAEAKG